MYNRPFLTPMWLMLALFAVICFIEFATYVQYRIPLFKLGYRVLVRPSVLLIETVLYFVIRYRFTPLTKAWTWVHICCTMSAFFVLGAFLGIFSLFWMDDNRETHQLVYQMESMLFWLLVIIGHVFFIMVLAKSFKANKST